MSVAHRKGETMSESQKDEFEVKAVTDLEETRCV